MKLLEGVMVLTCTPLNWDYSLNEQGVRKEIDSAIERGATGIWPGGYIAEWPQLDEETRKRYLKVSVEHAGSRVFCAAGCHATNTMQAIRLINYAEEIGYDCAWVSPTAPRKATEMEIYEHYKMIIEKTKLPIVLYNSYPIGTYMNPKLIAKIAGISDRIIAMKEMVGDFCHIVGLYNEGVHQKLKIFGVEYNMLPHLMLGAPGVLAGSDYVGVAAAAYKAFRDGNMEKAWELQKLMVAQAPLIIPQAAGMALGSKVEHSGIGYQKAKCSIATGVDLGPPMPPYKPASEAELERARREVEILKSVQV